MVPPPPPPRSFAAYEKGLKEASLEYSNRSYNSTNNSTTSTSKKPLPLKQRTSSVDARRDFSHATWWSLLQLLKLREFVVTVDHFSIWKRHLAWAVTDGTYLRSYLTQRYSASMIFSSLLLGAELNVLFNSAHVTTQVRQALTEEDYTKLEFWIGLTILVSSILTLLSLVSTFTAWTMISAVSPPNMHCILRSSMGQYVAELPGKFIVGSIYTFLLWLVLFFFLLLPVGVASLTLVTIALGLFVHTVAAFSAFGRIIMHTGAMGSTRIFDETYEAGLLPRTLHRNLLHKAQTSLHKETSIRRQYMSEPLTRPFGQQESMEFSPQAQHTRIPSSIQSSIPSFAANWAHGEPTARKRTGSLVRFADGTDTSGLQSPVLPSGGASGVVSGGASSVSSLDYDEDDERFEQEYGDLFDGEKKNSKDVQDEDDDEEAQWSVEHPRQEEEAANEQTQLLPPRPPHGGSNNYSSRRIDL